MRNEHEKLNKENKLFESQIIELKNELKFKENEVSTLQLKEKVHHTEIENFLRKNKELEINQSLSQKTNQKLINQINTLLSLQSEGSQHHDLHDHFYFDKKNFNPSVLSQRDDPKNNKDSVNHFFEKISNQVMNLKKEKTLMKFKKNNQSKII